MLDLFLARSIKYKQNRIGSNQLNYNKHNEKMGFGLKSQFYKKRIIFWHKSLKIELLDNFKQASTQKLMVECFLEI